MEGGGREKEAVGEEATLELRFPPPLALPHFVTAIDLCFSAALIIRCLGYGIRNKKADSWK